MMSTNEFIKSESVKHLIGAKLTIRGFNYHGFAAMDIKGNRHVIVLLQMVTEAFTKFLLESVKQKSMHKEDAKSYLREMFDLVAKKIDQLED